MKKLFLLLIFVVVAAMAVFAQTEGWWEKSGTGEQFKLKTQDYGFDCVFRDGTLEAEYIKDDEDGNSIYKANYGNVKVTLKVISDNVLYIKSTLDPVYRKYTKMKNSVNQSGYQNIQNNQKTNPDKCVFCKGTGHCPYCNSAGQSLACVQNPYGGNICTNKYCIANNHECNHCKGTHKCSNCNGTGLR